MQQLGAICYILMLYSISCAAQDTNTITFKVDMNSVLPKLGDSVLNVGVRGNVPPLSWVKGVKSNDGDGDGIYTATVGFEKGTATEVYFKYVLNDVEWESGDALKAELRPDADSSYKSAFRYVEQCENPFKKFIGEWTLKEDNWEQSHDGITIEKFKIPDHYTRCIELNTKNSLLCEVDATSARGHIFWTFNDSSREVHHNSSFYPSRIGIGKGNIDQNGNIQLSISFSGEPEGTYREYDYTWVGDDEYILKSVQYNASRKPTGDYYGGTFVRIKNRTNDR